MRLNDDSSSESDRIIEICKSNSSTDVEIQETLDTPDDSSGDDSPTRIRVIVPLQLSTKVKKACPSCVICDNQISREGSKENSKLPCQTKQQHVACILQYENVSKKKVTYQEKGHI